jgi:polyferredoxin
LIAATATDVPLAALALAMAAATAYLVKFTGQARDRRSASIALFLLAMMAEMFVAAIFYFRAPSAGALVQGLSVSGALMAVSAAAVLLSLPEEATTAPRDGSTAVPPNLRHRYLYLMAAIGLVLLNEALMAATFGIVSGSGAGSIGGGTASVASSLAGLFLSPWFVYTMAAEMGIATALLWNSLAPALRAMLPLQVLIMALSPPTLSISDWVTASVLAGSGAMIALFVYQMEYLYRHRELPAALARYLSSLFAVYAAMMVGLFLWLYYGTPELLAASVVAEMVVYFGAVLSLEGFSAEPTVSWQLRPDWAFGILSLVFVAEIFMGAVLDVRIDPATYLGGFPVLPLTGPMGTVLANAVSNGFWFLATVAASTWFLAMMGIEMGALVVFKMRETRHLENRIRLALMIGCYAAFAVFYPSLYFGLYFPHAPAPSTVPVLGWSMGIGSYPLAIGVFGVLVATYAITGALVVLFGRRVVCSTFCTAPLMYQGTTLDAMKSFNRSSPIGRKYLSSRFSNLYSVTTGVVMGSLVATSVLSYLDTTGAVSVYLQGNDPSVFLFTLYFSVLWYLMFVTIPYTGNYNCVTLGWCYTGTIAQAFQKVGFFKLKVRSKEVCKACTTLDCAKGCPVGLVDMPGHFRAKGEFRSTKCCGVGDCVEMCPYDNLYISDVRHWIRRRLGRPETSYPRGLRLPMAAPAGPPAQVAAAPAGPAAAPAEA